MGISFDFNDTIYGGTVASSSVPSDGPVAIGGHVYEIEPRKCTRKTIDALRQGSDVASEPGEQSFNTNGVWARTIDDWRMGCGQDFWDEAGSMRERFLDSKGIDIWTAVHQVQLLPDTVVNIPTGATNLHMVNTGIYTLLADGSTLRWTTDASAWPAMPAAGPIVSVATDGSNAYVAVAGHVLQRGPISGTLVDFGSFTADVVAYGNGRLVAADGSHIIELDNAGAPVAASLDYHHFNPSFVWRGIVATPAGFYAFGDAGGHSEIYFIAVDPNTTALAPPTPAWTVPFGELVRVMLWDVSVMVIGSDLGVRLATAREVGTLSAGALVEIPGGVGALTAYRGDVWFSWTDYDETSTGCGRLRLNRLVDAQALLPAYASDLMVAGQGTVVSLAIIEGKVALGVAGRGVFRPSASLVPSGMVRSGWIRHSTIETKVAVSLDVEHDPLEGTVGLFVEYDTRVEDGGSMLPVSTSVTQGSMGPVAPFAMGGRQYRRVQVDAVLNRDDDPTRGPVLRRLTMRSIAAPVRSDEVILALRLWSQVNGASAASMPSTRSFDVQAELVYLRSLVAASTPVRLQIGLANEAAIVRSVEEQPDRLDADSYGLEGLVGVTLMTMTGA